MAERRAAAGPGVRLPSAPAPAGTAPPDAERIADIRLLCCGFVGSVVASAALLAAAISRGELRIVAGVAVYAAGLMAMLGCSLSYRTATEPRRRQFCRRIDHAAIFAMIAGSATPFALARGGIEGALVLAALWAAAALGIAYKLSFPIGNLRHSTIIYLALGWFSMAAVGPAISTSTIMLIAAGGVFYSLGVPFLLWRRLRYRLAVWHGFVLAGAACHYLAILRGVVLA